MSQLEIADNSSRTTVEKFWGHEEIVTNNDRYCGKVLAMAPGWQSSKHYHPVKDETMLCIDGYGVVEVWPDIEAAGEPTYISLTGDEGVSVRLPAGTVHRFSTPFGEPMILVEFSTPHSDDDVVRLENTRELPEVVRS